MYYTIYRTINKINGKIYVGMHKTNDLDDGYMGSGKILKRAIEKYGIKNFEKEILHVFDTPEEMKEMEAVIVNEVFVARKDTYNLMCGGHGGFDYVNGPNFTNPTHDIKHMIAMNKKMVENRTAESWTRAGKRGAAVIVKNKIGIHDPNFDKGTFRGRTHTEETKNKIGKANSIHQKGNKNSQYGTMWITNGTKNKKISKNDLIPIGWFNGRKIK